MRKSAGILVSILAWTATALPFAANAFTASAVAVDDRLIAPATYEQYLSLDNPSGVAVSENYKAIADGNRIYVYAYASGEYRAYEHAHSLSSSATQDHISELHFASDGTLYFTDHAPVDNLFALDVATLTATQLDIACSTFVLDNQTIYFAGPTGALFYAPLDNCNAYVEMRLTPKNPVLAFWDDELYFTSTDDIQQHLYKIAPQTENATPASVADFSEPLTYMSIDGDVLACTTSGGTFHTYTLPTPSPSNSHIEQGAFSALTVYGDYCYLIERDVVREYSLQTQSFTGFEIGAGSPAKNRLDGATAITLINDKLLIADDGNLRISVYDCENGVFQTPIATEQSVSFLAADESSVLAANSKSVTLYSLREENYGEKLYSFDAFGASVIGVVNVYGTYYLATDLSQSYALSFNGEWTLSQAVQTTLSGLKAITADAYGNVYALTGSNIYKYTETEFIDSGVEGQKLNPTLPQNVRSIAVDYDGDVYALSGSSVFNLTKNTEVSFATPLVYPKDENAEITAFAFGVEENQTYLLCDTYYVTVSERLHLPTVKTIDVSGADEKVFENAAAEFSIVRIQKNALLVQFDLQRLKGATYFPYLGLTRTTEEPTALKIGETEKYYLLAEYDAENGGYDTYLAVKEFCSAYDSADYETKYSETERKTGYLTNAVPLYKFPYLTELLTVTTLERGAKITLLGEIDKLDHPYYQVSYVGEDGTEQIGYVPQAYVTQFSGIPQDSETLIVGETESNEDAVWRFAYLLLGFGAICVLVDYLLLRKKKGDD